MYGHTAKSKARDEGNLMALTYGFSNVNTKKYHTGAKIKNPRDKSTFLYFFI
jgi:hypothetical protein